MSSVNLVCPRVSKHLGKIQEGCFEVEHIARWRGVTTQSFAFRPFYCCAHGAGGLVGFKTGGEQQNSYPCRVLIPGPIFHSYVTNLNIFKHTLTFINVEIHQICELFSFKCYLTTLSVAMTVLCR